MNQQIWALKVGDRLTIGNVKLIVMEKNKNNVKLGLDAPRDVSIVRSEAMEKFAKR